MHAIRRSATFRKNLKREAKSPRFKEATFLTAVNTLARGEALAPRYRNHKLAGEFFGCFECHLQPDLLLIYLIDREAQVLQLVRVGSHAELFG